MFVPKSYAHAMVFHALIHHGVTIAELRDAVRYVAPHGDDWPENVRWGLSATANRRANGEATV